MRSLEEVDSQTPPEYWGAFPPNPQIVAIKMLNIAQKQFPITDSLNSIQSGNYSFLFVGPGSGLVIQQLLNMGHIAQGLETSRRAIAAAPDEVRSYIGYCLPWENNFASMASGAGNKPAPRKNVHVAVISKYLKEYLTPTEWNKTVSEIKKVAKFVATI